MTKDQNIELWTKIYLYFLNNGLRNKVALKKFLKAVNEEYEIAVQHIKEKFKTVEPVEFPENVRKELKQRRNK